ncbi:unnamed protein product [Thelazia callipaeda]|uniref:C2H2-type domain-containing protein n=1 Tax=Thelazia callipaeda TaxID=103827 RepID=A0A0N5CXC0_THECL|nr:unnamed protein product [Thelazia callipaeda]
MNNSIKRRKADVKRLEKKHICQTCSARFPFPNKLRLHIKSNHSRKFFAKCQALCLAHACELCPLRFNRFNELRTHMCHAHKIIHSCHLCTYSSGVKAELKKHVIRCHESGVRCTIGGCTAVVAYNRLRRHISEVHCAGKRNIQSSSNEENDQALKIPAVTESHSDEEITDAKSVSTVEESGFESNTSEDNSVVSSCQPSVDQVNAQNLQINEKERLNTATVAETNYSVLHGEVEFNQVCQRKVDYSDKGESGNSLASIKTQKTEQKDTMISFASTESGKYSCPECKKAFQCVKQSRQHWNRTHREKRSKLKTHGCEVSEYAKRLLGHSELQGYVSAAYNQQTSYTCSTCIKEFSSRAQFAIHLQRYHLVSIRDVPHGFSDETNVSGSHAVNGLHTNLQNVMLKRRDIPA